MSSGGDQECGSGSYAPGWDPFAEAEVPMSGASAGESEFAGRQSVESKAGGGASAAKNFQPMPSWQWVLVSVAVLSVGAVGVSLFSMVASVRLRATAGANVSGWSSVFLLAALVGMVAFCVAIVAIARSRRRLLPLLALLGILILTPWAAVTGVKLGADVASVQVGSDVQALVAQAGPVGALVQQLLELVQ